MSDYTDMQRLDWLARNCERESHMVVAYGVVPCVAWAIASAPGRSLRETIDAAMDAAPGFPPIDLGETH